MDSLTVRQLEDALAYLHNPLQSGIPDSIADLTETQWIAIEMVATQLKEERASMIIH